MSTSETVPYAPPHALPAPVRVVLLRRWFTAVAVQVRPAPRGAQTLVTLGTTRTWVPSSRVRYLDDDPATNTSTPAG